MRREKEGEKRNGRWYPRRWLTTPLPWVPVPDCRECKRPGLGPLSKGHRGQRRFSAGRRPPSPSLPNHSSQGSPRTQICFYQHWPVKLCAPAWSAGKHRATAARLTPWSPTRCPEGPQASQRDLGNPYPAFWPRGSALQRQSELADLASKYLAWLFWLQRWSQRNF